MREYRVVSMYLNRGDEKKKLFLQKNWGNGDWETIQEVSDIDEADEVVDYLNQVENPKVLKEYRY